MQLFYSAKLYVGVNGHMVGENVTVINQNGIVSQHPEASVRAYNVIYKIIGMRGYLRTGNVLVYEIVIVD